eukprot:2318613-Pyramimonas_sp.AAC.1
MRGCTVERHGRLLYPLLQCVTRSRQIGRRCLEPDSGGHRQNARYAGLCPVDRSRASSRVTNK